MTVAALASTVAARGQQSRAEVLRDETASP